MNRRTLCAALALSCPSQLAAQTTFHLAAVDSVSISRSSPRVFADNRMRAYDNPSGSILDAHGIWKFDTSGLPPITGLVSIRLTLAMENAFGSPFGGPIVNLHHSSDDVWTRATATATSALPGAIVTSNATSFVHPQHVFTLDLQAHDFRVDLADGAITLVADNVNGAYSYVYFFGHTGTPSGPNADLEIVAHTCLGRTSAIGVGGQDSSGFPTALSASGCPDRRTSLRLDVATGASVTAPIALELGLSRASWLGIPLPLDLAPFGAPGNSILCAWSDTLIVLPNPGGGSGLAIPIPAGPQLLGATGYLQAVLFDPPANALGLVATNALQIVVG
jgi:hypothetical protein